MRLEKKEAVALLHYAYEHGVTLFDTANAYADSEEKVGEAFHGMRDKVVIATKTAKRDAAGAMEHLELSLRKLRTDYIDVYQLHQVSKESEWEEITGPNGAMEAILKARDEGKVRHIGFTSHNLNVAIKIAKTGRFATVQFPFNFIESDPEKELFPLAREIGMGILAMKPFGGGALDDGKLALKFILQSKGVVPLPGFDATWQIDQAISTLQENPGEITGEELAAIERYREELGKEFCRRCEYCQPCPQGVEITPAMQYELVSRKMPLETLLSFSGPAMETVQNCIECGTCIERCPYSLSIPQVIKRNYDLYKRHLEEAKRK
jgi:predicted aldo/keto reductase-like oxidoreductase